MLNSICNPPGELRQTVVNTDVALSWCLKCSDHISVLTPGIQKLVNNEDGKSDTEKLQRTLAMTAHLWSKLAYHKQVPEEKSEVAFLLVTKVQELESRLGKVLDCEGKGFLMAALRACFNEEANCSDALDRLHSLRQMCQDGPPALQACFRTVSAASQIAQDKSVFTVRLSS